MPTLTRKRVNERPDSWHIHFAGVRVGAIAERSGVPRRRQIGGNGPAVSIQVVIRATTAMAPR